MEEPITGHEDNDYQLSASTSGGNKTRGCPVCKKLFKMERLGKHVREKHRTEYEALFTVARLSDCIEHKQLTKFTVQYEEKDTDFLHCFACCSVRTTDRNHFQGKETHLAEHVELAEKLIAKKTGVKYVPVTTTEVAKLKRELDRVKRDAKIDRKNCDEEHGQFDTHIVLKQKEIDTLNLKVTKLEQQLQEEKHTAISRGNRIEYLERGIKVIMPFVKEVQNEMGGLYTSNNERVFNSCQTKISQLYNWCSKTMNS